MVFQHKMANVESGRLVHHPTRGWLDAAHYWETRTQLCRVYRHLSKHDAPGPVTLTRTHASADGALRKLRVRYTFTPGLPASAAPWRAAGVALDIGLREERFQDAAHPLTGLAMSAFSFEDLPSAMAAALDVTAADEIDAACAQRPDDRIPGARADLDRWRREGRQLVGLRRDTVAPDQESPPAVHTLWRRMQAERETWRGETPAHP